MKYYTTGADNQTYGPVDITTLRQWAAEGRITPNTPLTDETGAHTVLTSVLLSADALPPVTPQFVPGPHAGMQCRNCGQVSPIGTRLCPRCGTPLQSAAPNSGGDVLGVGTLGCVLALPLFLGSGFLLSSAGNVIQGLGAGTLNTVLVVFVYLSLAVGLYFLVHRWSPAAARGLGYGLLVGSALLLGAVVICGPMAKHI